MKAPFSKIAAAMALLWLIPMGSLRAAMPPEEARRLLDEGTDHFYNLEYDAALADFQQLRADDPRNPAWQNRVALSYFYKELYQAGVLEGDLFDASNRFFRTKKFPTVPELEDGFRAANQRAISMCETQLKNNSKEESALYSCGVAYAARATHQALVERSALNFLSAARKANDYHSRLIKIDPHYYDGYLVPGVYDFVLGSLPGPMKFVFFFAGLVGDKQKGLELVESAAQKGDGAKYDAQILLAVMYRRERRYSDAVHAMESLEVAFPRNYILSLEIASLHRAAGEVPAAIHKYEEALQKVQAGTPNYALAPVARIHFELGALYRGSGDLASARRHLQNVAGSRGSTLELEKASTELLSQIVETAPK